jgi:DNA-binding beta-propeller fold protein YncE
MFRTIALTIFSDLVALAAASAVSAGAPVTLQYRTSFPEHPIAGLPLSAPQALAADDAGHLYVVDTGNNRVVKLDDTGALLAVVGGFGWEKEQFDTPVDASIKRGLDLYVVDHNNERVERYDRKLNYISSYKSDPNLAETRQFGFPVSVDVSRHGELFICDADNNRVLKLDAFGQPSLSFGDFNAGEGQLQSPVKIEIAKDDLIYVSDRDKDQIVVFDYYGNFVTRFGENLLSDPAGLIWLEGRLLFVADAGNHRIVVFNNRLVVAAMLAGREAGAEGLQLPVDVAVWKSRLYVLDSTAGRVRVFDIITNTGE